MEGSWIMARDLHTNGEATSDIVQAYILLPWVCKQFNINILIGFSRGTICLVSMSDLERARDAALGSRETCVGIADSLPVEQFEDRSKIKSVCSSQRCYPLGVTYKRQTVFSAPNANSKLRNGLIDRNTQLCIDLLKVNSMSPNKLIS